MSFTHIKMVDGVAVLTLPTMADDASMDDFMGRPVESVAVEHNAEEHRQAFWDAWFKACGRPYTGRPTFPR